MRSGMTSEAIEVPVGGGAGGPTHDLEALWGEAGGAALDGAVLAPPHPLYGGTIDAPILLALAGAARDGGVRALRFNWRGIGASTGRATDDPAAAVEDYRAALAEVARRAPGRLFAGRVNPAIVGLREQLQLRVFRPRTGDFRDWDKIRDWSRGVAEELGSAAPASARSVSTR